MKRETSKIILFVGPILSYSIKSIRAHEKKTGTKYRIALLYDKRKHTCPVEKVLSGIDIVITCNINAPVSIEKALRSYRNDLIAVTCTSESTVPALRMVIPHVPYLRTPTEKSLIWSTDKLQMRSMLTAYDSSISPAYTTVSNATKETCRTIAKTIGFPVVVKPTGLAASMLVSICYHQEELLKTLRSNLRKLKTVYKKNSGRGEPQLLVEQFMEGEMYSVDAYVGSRGKIYFCPLVHIKTGRSIGFDDFFGYRRLTPTQLSKTSVEAAQEIASKAIKAVGLRNIATHIELMKTNDGWKIIEIGPRVGGHRHVMYQKSFGIDHLMNDILIRIPETPIIPKKTRGYTAAFQFYARKEGVLKKINGVKKVKELKSFSKMSISKKPGAKCAYAKNGGSGVLYVILFNKNRADLLADIRILNKTIKIVTE